MKVLLVQLPVPSFALNWRETRNIPLAAGYLKSSIRSTAAADVAILDRESADLKGDAYLLKTIVAEAPDIVGLTCYSWNLARTLHLAGALKSEMPSCTIVAGGPEVTYSGGALQESPAVDLAVVGEGEGAFSDILSHLSSGAPALDDVRGIIFRRGGRRVVTPPREPLSELGEIDSPYLRGYIDPAEYGSMAIETMRGCPYRCRYCGYPKRFPGLRKFPLERVAAEVALARGAGVRQVNILDPSFDAGDRLREVSPLLARLNKDGALAFFTDLRAEALDAAAAALLAGAGFASVEVGLQSASAAVLEGVGRRPDLDAFLKGVDLLREGGIEVRVNVIVGLPGDTLEGVRRTVSFLEENGLSSCAVASVLQLLPGTELREEAAAFSLEFQREPPYYALRTREMDYRDIRSALLLCEETFPLSYKLATRFFDMPSLATSSSASPRGGANGAPWEGAGAARHPVTKVVIDLAPGHSPSPSILRDVSHVLSSSPVVWFRVSDADTAVERMREVLSTLARHNPHAAWNVVVETDRAFRTELFGKLRAAVAREGRFLDNYFCYRSDTLGGPAQIPQFFTVLRSRPISCSAAWLKDVSKASAIFWSVTHGGPGDRGAMASFEGAGVPGGLLIDFSPGTRRPSILAAMENLRRGPLGERPVQFRNRFLQHVWLHGQGRIARSGRVDEFILFCEGGEGARALRLTEEGLLLDQAEWLLRKES